MDIADPTAPAYCLDWISEPPLSALHYLSSEYDSREPEDIDEAVVTSIKELIDVNLVTIEMLAQAWPSEYKRI